MVASQVVNVSRTSRVLGVAAAVAGIGTAGVAGKMMANVDRKIDAAGEHRGPKWSEALPILGVALLAGTLAVAGARYGWHRGSPLDDFAVVPDTFLALGAGGALVGTHQLTN